MRIICYGRKFCRVPGVSIESKKSGYLNGLENQFTSDFQVLIDSINPTDSIDSTD